MPRFRLNHAKKEQDILKEITDVKSHARSIMIMTNRALIPPYVKYLLPFLDFEDDLMANNTVTEDQQEEELCGAIALD